MRHLTKKLLVLGYASLFLVGLSFNASANFRITASSLKLKKEGERVIISLAGGVKGIGSDGMVLTAGACTAILSTKSFPSLHEDVEGEEVMKGRLPSLPAITLNKQSIKLFRLHSSFSLVTKEFSLIGSSVETRDAGATWRSGGSVKFVSLSGSLSLSGKDFIFIKRTGSLKTTQPLRITAPKEGISSAILNARETMYDISSRKMILKGDAEVSVDEYHLLSDTIKVDLGAGIISAEGPCRLISGQSILDASSASIKFQGKRAVVRAEGLTGKLKIK